MKFSPTANNRLSFLTIIALTFLAFALRLWRLDSVPPGWRDDELINSLVISQKVLDGDWAVYYPDASGHEALYHVLNAIMLDLFGPGIFGIRWLSVILGTLTIPITFILGKRMMGNSAGLVAAGSLTISFWSIMYSRIGLRHILLPFLTVGAFYFFWIGINQKSKKRSLKGYSWFLLSSMFMGLGFYTYFAARGIPLLILAYCGYLWLFERLRLKKYWRELIVLFGLAAVFALPLLITLGQQPESETRVAELAVPLVEASAGNFALLWDHISITLQMFHSDGDGEWLYNIPHRPVFGLLGAIFFWSGVLIAIWYSLSPLWKKRNLKSNHRKMVLTTEVVQKSQVGAFLLVWWLAGISPAFISVPPASLGHTILAQPAVFLLAALPVWMLLEYPLTRFQNNDLIRRGVPVILAILFLSSIAWRDLPAYFHEWPGRGMVRFLYRADIHEVARYLNQNPGLLDFGITGLLAGPWDKIALNIDLDDEQAARVRPRWYNPERAILLQPPIHFSSFPNVPTPYGDLYDLMSEVSQIGGYQLNQVEYYLDNREQICFQNGLCWLSARYDQEANLLELGWGIKHTVDLPVSPLISNPPPPGVYAGPRLLVFGQLQDQEGNFLVGDDGLWVDPTTLQEGDQFLQQHRLIPPPGAKPSSIVFGLYDPLSGERILTDDSHDHIQLKVED